MALVFQEAGSSLRRQIGGGLCGHQQLLSRCRRQIVAIAARAAITPYHHLFRDNLMILLSGFDDVADPEQQNGRLDRHGIRADDSRASRVFPAAVDRVGEN